MPSTATSRLESLLRYGDSVDKPAALYSPAILIMLRSCVMAARGPRGVAGMSPPIPRERHQLLDADRTHASTMKTRTTRACYIGLKNLSLCRRQRPASHCLVTRHLPLHRPQALHQAPRCFDVALCRPQRPASYYLVTRHTAHTSPTGVASGSSLLRGCRCHLPLHRPQALHQASRCFEVDAVICPVHCPQALHQASRCFEVALCRREDMLATRPCPWRHVGLTLLR